MTELPEVLRAAPRDVQATVAWLSENGYQLTSRSGGGSFGAELVFEGEVMVRIAVDRSQWMLDVALSPGADPWQYDLLIAAHSGQEYGERFPRTVSREAGNPLPDQLPAGLSWRETLPDIVRWMRGDDIAERVSKAQQERARLMWGRGS